MLGVRWLLGARTVWAPEQTLVHVDWVVWNIGPYGSEFGKEGDGAERMMGLPSYTSHLTNARRGSSRREVMHAWLMSWPTMNSSISISISILIFMSISTFGRAARTRTRTMHLDKAQSQISAKPSQRDIVHLNVKWETYHVNEWDRS